MVVIQFPIFLVFRTKFQFTKVMPRELHLSNETNEENEACLDVQLHSSPPTELSLDVQLHSSPPTEQSPTEQSQCTKRPRKPKFDHTNIFAVRVDAEGLLNPSNDCSQLCTHYFYQGNDAEGVTWKKVTAKTKQFYWGEFKKSITHEGFDEAVVHEAWKKIASKRYKDWISKMSKLKKKPIRGVEQKTWDACNIYWKSDEFKKKSERGSNNRHRNGKGMVNHTGGSQRFGVTLDKMQKNGLNPDPAEFHKQTHSRKVNNELVFCDDYAAEVHAAYMEREREALLELQTQAVDSGSSVPTELPMSTKALLFKEAAGGEKKGAVYGFGSAAKEFYSFKSRGSTSVACSSGSGVEVELRKKIKDLEEAASRVNEERDKAIALAIHETEKRANKLVRKMEKKVEKMIRKMTKKRKTST